MSPTCSNHPLPFLLLLLLLLQNRPDSQGLFHRALGDMNYPRSFSEIDGFFSGGICCCFHFFDSREVYKPEHELVTALRKSNSRIKTYQAGYLLVFQQGIWLLLLLLFLLFRLLLLLPLS